MPGSSVFRYTSPLLADGDDAIVRECPVGLVLRETPQVYEALSAFQYHEHAGLDALRFPRWIQECFRIIASEQARLRELAEADRRAKQDGAHGRRVLRGR